MDLPKKGVLVKGRESTVHLQPGARKTRYNSRQYLFYSGFESPGTGEVTGQTTRTGVEKMSGSKEKPFYTFMFQSLNKVLMFHEESMNREVVYKGFTGYP